VVAALRQNEELRDHPHHAAASADTPSPRGGRPGCDCNVTRRSEAVDRRLCVPQPHLPCRATERASVASRPEIEDDDSERKRKAHWAGEGDLPSVTRAADYMDGPIF
jgi:hypothetical protein